MTVNPLNDAPVAGVDTYTVDEDGTLQVDLTNGLLVNDSDIDGNTITATVVTQPAHGTLTLAPNGTFFYSPSPNFKLRTGTRSKSPCAPSIPIRSAKALGPRASSTS